jgi:hypothetical protein
VRERANEDEIFSLKQKKLLYNITNQSSKQVLLLYRDAQLSVTVLFYLNDYD